MAQRGMKFTVTNKLVVEQMKASPRGMGAQL